jgi:hypothetical protein
MVLKYFVAGVISSFISVGLTWVGVLQYYYTVADTFLPSLAIQPILTGILVTISGAIIDKVMVKKRR